MDAPTKAFFSAQCRGDNNLCFDCGQREPQWASCNNGIYICLDCSGRHRSIGCHLSFVRCIWMDVWKPVQLMMMKEGGNARLAEYLDEHGPKNWRKLPITEKYGIPAVDKYRKLLREKVDAASAAQVPLFEPGKATAPKTRTLPPAISAFSLFESDSPPEKKLSEVPAPVKSKTRTLPPTISTISDFFEGGFLDIVTEAEGIVDALVGPSPLSSESDKPAEAKPRNVSCLSSKHVVKQQAVTSSVMPDLETMVLEEPTKVTVDEPAASPAVDVWGDDFWD